MISVGDRQRMAASLLVLLLVAGSLGSSPTMAGKATLQAGVADAATKVPVLLVHGLASSPVAAWGAPAEPGPASSRWWEEQAALTGEAKSTDPARGKMAQDKASPDEPLESKAVQSQFPAAASDGMYAFLVKVGYVPGRTLFFLDYEDDNNGDYVQIARQRLAPFIERIKEITGSPWVDVIAHSMGGLITRFYLAEGGAANVRQVILLGTPSHGSFAANILKELAVMRQYEQYLAAQAGPSGGMTKQGPLGEKGNYPNPVLPSLSEMALNFVHRRISFYGPIFRDYLLQERFGPTKKDEGFRGTAETKFKGYFIRHFPQQYEDLFRNGQKYPLALSLVDLPPEKGDGTGFRPGAEPPVDFWALSRAYFEALALDMAGHFYAAQWREEVPVVNGPKKESKVAGGGWAPIVANPLAAPAYIMNWLTEKWFALFSSWAGERGLRDQVLETAGWLKINPASVAIDRLLLEKMEFSPPGELLLGNLFLASWNDWDARQRAQEPATFRPFPGPRYVIIAGGILNPWHLVWPQIGENDSVVEVASAFLPLEKNDVFRLFQGSLKSHHLALTRRRDVQEFIRRELDQYFPVRRRLVPTLGWSWWRFAGWSQRGTLEVSNWQPNYLAVEGDKLGGHGGEIEVEFFPVKASPPAALQIWVYGEDATGHFERITERVLADSTWEGKGDSGLTIVGLGDRYRRLLVGFRLGTEGPAEDKEPWFEKNARINYRISFWPKEGGAKQEQSMVAANGGAPAPAGKPELGPFNPSQTKDRPAGESPGKGPAGGPGEPPILSVRGINRNTAEQNEDRNYHLYWDWQFQGQKLPFKEGENGLTSAVTLNFSQPGTYLLQGRSVSNKGDLLRDFSWPIVVKPEDLVNGPLTRTFELETAREPKVNLEIVGPRKWITGLPATFTTRTQIEWPDQAEQEVVTLYPGREFQVIWDKPGRFPVTVAVKVGVRYRFPEKTYVLRNTYVKKVWVEVITTGTSD